MKIQTSTRKTSPVFSRKKSQLLRLCKDIQFLHESGRWHSLEQSKKESLLDKLFRLWKMVRSYLNGRELRRILASLAFLIGFASVGTAQILKAPQVNPFGLKFSNEGKIKWAEFADLDNDGDMDILGSLYDLYSYESTYYYVINKGTKSNPDFGSPVNYPISSRFGIWNIGTLVDIDGDGDLDIFTMIPYSDSVSFRENTGTNNNISFGREQWNPFGIDPSNLSRWGAFASGDLDGDGDFDLLYFDVAVVWYFENTGDRNNPKFGTPTGDPFNLSHYGLPWDANLVDLDNDGDLDILVSSYYDTYYYSDILYYKNNGTKTNPSFADSVINPFGLDKLIKPYYHVLSIAAADLDSDGDQDLLFTDWGYDYDQYTYGTNYYYVENARLSGINMDKQYLAISAFPQPCTEQVTFDLGSLPGNKFIVRITDVNGKVCMEKTLFGATRHTLIVNDLEQGTYFYTVVGEKATSNGKLIIQNE